MVPPFMEPPYIFLFDGLWCDIWMIPNMEDPELVNCEWLMEILKKYNDKPLEKWCPIPRQIYMIMIMIITISGFP